MFVRVRQKVDYSGMHQNILEPLDRKVLVVVHCSSGFFVCFQVRYGRVKFHSANFSLSSHILLWFSAQCVCRSDFDTVCSVVRRKNALFNSLPT